MTATQITREFIAQALSEDWWTELDEFVRDNSGTPSVEEIEAVLTQQFLARHDYGQFSEDENESTEGWRLLIWTAAREWCEAEAEQARERLIAEQDRQADETEAAVVRLCQLAESALFGLALRGRPGSSRYGRYESGPWSVSVRVSDHEQVYGGGWDELTGERMGEADLSLVIGEDHTRESIRAAVAALIREQRDA